MIFVVEMALISYLHKIKTVDQISENKERVQSGPVTNGKDWNCARKTLLIKGLVRIDYYMYNLLYLQCT